MDRFYVFGAVLLTAAVLVFAMQNLHPVTIEFILWEIDTPVSLVALVAFLAGIVIGWLSGRFRKGSKAKAKAKALKAAATQPALGAGDPTSETASEEERASQPASSEP